MPQATGSELSIFLACSEPRDGIQLLRNVCNTDASTPCHIPENVTLYYLSYIHSIIFHFLVHSHMFRAPTIRL